MVKIIKCSCEFKYQDLKYGKGNRVANENSKGRGRCTVCGKEQ